jgi:hypothetical protein
LEANPSLTYILALCDELSPSSLGALLRSPNSESALAAAVGGWFADPRSITADLMDDWRRAVLQTGTEITDRSLQSGLARVLTADPILAFDWLRARLRAGALPSLRVSEGRPFRAALSVLSAEQRSSLLAELAPSPDARRLLPYLIGRDMVLYRQLLKRNDLRKYQLAPLEGPLDAKWIPLALAAAEAGWRDREIAQAALRDRPVQPRSATGIECWSRWQRFFSALEADPHEEIRAVGRAGQELVEPRIQQARAEERQTALRGH